MNYKIVTQNNNKCIECTPDVRRLSTEKDVLDCISICMEKDIYKVILHSNVLSEDFFKNI